MGHSALVSTASSICLTTLASLLFLDVGMCLVLFELLHLFVLLKVIKTDFENSIGLKGGQESMFGKSKNYFQCERAKCGKGKNTP